jgi:AcrR family transcriptional regulator
MELGVKQNQRAEFCGEAGHAVAANAKGVGIVGRKSDLPAAREIHNSLARDPQRRFNGMAKRTARLSSKPRQRLLAAAYDLFAAQGVKHTGVNDILRKAGCAKASLYQNFESKVDLALAFLERRETVWTRGWLETEIGRRASDPKNRLLAVFDVFEGWFHKRSFEGCSFINVLLESSPNSPVRKAAAIHLSNIRSIVRTLAEEARLRDPEAFAQAWHMLMKGSIVSACEGNRNAARDAMRAAKLVLAGWPKVTGRRLSR